MIGGGRVTGVDGEQLAFDVGRQVGHPGRVRDLRRVGSERRALDRPLEVGLDGDVEPGVGRLGRHDPVDRRVGEDRLGRDRRPFLVRAVLTNVPGQHVGGVDRVLAGHHRQRGLIGGPLEQRGGDGRRHEFEHGGTDRGGDDVGRRELADEFGVVAAAVDRPVVVDPLGPRVEPDLDDLIAGRHLQGIDEGLGDVGEDHLVPGPVQDQADEPAPDVARAEMDGCGTHVDSSVSLR